MITGTHVIIYSKDADADRVFFKDKLGFEHVDAGHGWLIFKAPPTEMAFHPDTNYRHEMYFMCDDIEKTITELTQKGVKCSRIQEEPWGRLITLQMPGGGVLGVYEPKHPTTT